MGGFATADQGAFTLAVLSALVLATVAVARRPRSRHQWSFAAGLVGLGAEAAAAFVLMTMTESPEQRVVWLRVRDGISFLLLVPWLAFVASLCGEMDRRWPRALRVGVAIGQALALVGAGVMSVAPGFDVSEVPGTFYAAQLNAMGRVGVIVQLLLTAALLGGLESCLRAADRPTRWRIKYLIVGLGAIFLGRFFFLGQTLLFQVLLSGYVSAGAATLLAGNVALAASVARDRLLGGALTVSRQVLYRSVVVSVLGLYLLTVGGLGWLFNHLGFPEEMLWGSLVVFLSAVALTALLLSESLRWRMKRFIALNFYRSRYDYREEWGRFTKRLGSLLTVEQLGVELLGALTDAAGTAKAALYLHDTRDDRYHRTAALEMDDSPRTLEHTALARLEKESGPLVLDIEAASALALGEGTALVPLRWQGRVLGFIAIGAERTGAAWTPEDLEFFATVGEQAAGVIATARLSETLAQAREFEAFHRLTSFVIHDLKNAVSALSLLSQNALEHFEDPEFQRDAVRTLSRSVDRMKALLSRLSSAPDTALRFQPVDVAALALEAVRPFDGSGRISLVKELGPVGAVPGDAEALLRVIQNLVTNAVEAMEGQGVVTVETYERDGRAVCAITDTGTGMSQDFLQRSLFAPFRSTKKGGWGIGLYQAKSVVEAHGGAIEVTSREGVGTTFRVSLPLSRRSGEKSR